tara:strand:- start:5 stop:247 length:243 start_codon:yes stop_codon:yes gene_type:complete
MLGVWLDLHFRVGNLVMNYIEDEELLTKRELIEEIISSVEEKLWSGDDRLIMETAQLIGLDVVAHTDGHGLFWKKDSTTT